MLRYKHFYQLFRFINKPAITTLLAVAVIVGMASCGTGKKAVNTSFPPRTPVKEISLDDLTGRGRIITTPEVELSARARAVVDAAHKWLGTTYRYGGDSRSGVDCSALVMNVYRESLGIKIPRTTALQSKYVTQVSRRDLHPGDLVFFSSNKNHNGISHVGLYIGNDRFIHASSSRGVVVSRLSEKYFMSHYHSSGRVVEMFGRGDAGLIAMCDNSDNDLAQKRLDMLDEILTAAIDSIYSIPVDDDPNLAPGL